MEPIDRLLIIVVVGGVSSWPVLASLSLYRTIRHYCCNYRWKIEIVGSVTEEYVVDPFLDVVLVLHILELGQLFTCAPSSITMLSFSS